MNIFGKALLVSLGIAASTLVSLAPASAQYYGHGYERNLQAQKRAIKAQRQAQKQAIRGGYYGGRAAYGRGGYRGAAPGYYRGAAPGYYRGGPVGGGVDAATGFPSRRGYNQPGNN